VPARHGTVESVRDEEDGDLHIDVDVTAALKRSSTM
jgi:hypothetical protein